MIAQRNTLCGHKAGAWAGARARAWAGAGAGARAGARAWAGAGARAWAGARAGASLCGVFQDPELFSLWWQGANGDVAAWCAFIDKLQEINGGNQVYGIQAGDVVFIETPTVYFLGRVAHADLMCIELDAGGYEIRYVSNLYTFLHKGKFADSDEATLLPSKCKIPALSVCVSHEWSHKSLPKPNRTPAQMEG